MADTVKADSALNRYKGVSPTEDDEELPPIPVFVRVRRLKMDDSQPLFGVYLLVSQLLPAKTLQRMQQHTLFSE